jgi:branched-chain amino acid transport system ATP-binding protein
MLRVRDLSAGYGRITVLHDITIEVNIGEIVAVMGANGSGKSTLCRSLAGLLRPRSGYIEFLGENMVGRPPVQMVRSGLVLVPEARQVFPRMTVRENLLMGAYARHDREAIDRDLGRMFDRFPILGRRSKQAAGSLSGGEQQMLAIARGLMSSPRLLMLDEPSHGLAPAMVDRITELIADVARSGTAVLLVEQNLAIPAEIATRGYVLSAGHRVAEGDNSEMFKSGLIESVYLGG